VDALAYTDDRQQAEEADRGEDPADDSANECQQVSGSNPLTGSQVSIAGANARSGGYGTSGRASDLSRAPRALDRPARW
jgi:hypothetical protein